MEYSRRDFLRFGCLTAGALAGVSLFGCSSQPSNNDPGNSSDISNDEDDIVDTDSEGSSDSSSGTNEVGNDASPTTAVVFFSCTGNTEAVAEKIAVAADGTLMRIEPAEPYSAADLDYNSNSRANDEQDSGSARPAIASPVPDVTTYSTVYLGYPIWWGKAPRIVLTFLEDTDFTGKTIVPFCTSGSSSISGSIPEIVQAAPGANIVEGRRFAASVSQQEIDAWVDSL